MIKKLFSNKYFKYGVIFLYFLILNYLLFYLDERILTIFLITFFTYLFFIGLREISKILSFVFLVIFLFIFIIVFTTQELFGLINPPQMMALYFTNSTEVMSYISTIPKIVIAKAILMGFPLLFLPRLMNPLFSKKTGFIILLIPIFYTGIKAYLQKDYIFSNKFYSFKTVYISPFRILTKVNGVQFLVEREIEYQNKLQTQPHTWKVLSVGENNKITIFVIGESVRKDFMGLYNPIFNNTPFLNSIPKIQFDNTISFASTTIPSLTNAFQQNMDGKPYFPNNIITLAKAAGYKTIWLSNQGSIGTHDNNIAAMAKQADKHQFLTSGTFETYKKDETLLSLLEKELKVDSHNIYFLHTIGSHPSPCSITDDEYQKFYSSKEVSCYIESIYRTDKLIENLYIFLQQLNKPFQIIYFSDHGLYLTPDQILVHKSGYKESYEVPLFIIDSELTETVHIKAQRNLKDFILLYQELLKIKTENINKNYNFISEEFIPNSNLLEDGLNYNSLIANSHSL